MNESSHIDPANNDYCYRCDTDTHYCGGCGGNLDHGATCVVCDTEIKNGER